MKNSLLIDYVIIAASTSVIILVGNYNLLIWADKRIPEEMVPLITGLSTGVFTAITLRSPDKPDKQ